MEPKEKAIELLDKMSAPIEGHSNIYYRQCTKIAIDEIIKALPPYKYGLEFVAKIEFWKNVKKELEKL